MKKSIRCFAPAERSGQIKSLGMVRGLKRIYWISAKSILEWQRVGCILRREFNRCVETKGKDTSMGGTIVNLNFDKQLSLTQIFCG
ncbi:hypothetical protein BH10BAC5_BH10BAC5_19380 [soil metagenome]